jgi:hypothetical protein
MFIFSLIVVILVFLFIVYYLKKNSFEDKFVKFYFDKTKEPETELDYKPIRKKNSKKKTNKTLK